MPGEITRELLTTIKKYDQNVKTLRVADVRIGMGYTGVMLNDGSMGVCHTLTSELFCCQKNIRAGSLAGSPVFEIAELADSWKLDEAIVGVATLNALSQRILEREAKKYLYFEGTDFLDQIKIKKDDTVAMVGYFRPFISEIRSRAKNLYILERNLSIGEKAVIPDTACGEIVPKADIVIITGTAFANGTIDHLLELSQNARETGLVGPTASMVPDPIFQRGATIMGGIKVTDAKRLLQIISEGGGVPQFKEACKQIVIKPKL
jgi:uncharacterized protein (DUF4213/DUF364 family)